jgi:hypothetical protein
MWYMNTHHRLIMAIMHTRSVSAMFLADKFHSLVSSVTAFSVSCSTFYHAYKEKEVQVGQRREIQVGQRQKARTTTETMPLYNGARSTDKLMEREQALIDALLVRYKNIIELAPIPEGTTIKEAVAAQSFQMEVETAALVRTVLDEGNVVLTGEQISAAEDLLRLTRELKEMWLFGPLRDLGEGEEDVRLDEDATKVDEMVEAHLKKRRP